MLGRLGGSDFEVILSSGPWGDDVEAAEALVAIAADVDGDGDQDLIASTGVFDRPSNGIYWFENRLPGDTNDDGTVDFTDFLALSAGFGKSDVSWDDGDFDNNGIVNFVDFLALSGNFQQSRNR